MTMTNHSQLTLIPETKMTYPLRVNLLRFLRGLSVKSNGHGGAYYQIGDWFYVQRSGHGVFCDIRNGDGSKGQEGTQTKFCQS